MRIVALLAVRNEERYLQRCLEHLYRQMIDTCLIDNGSTDRTLEIARDFLDRGVIRIEHLPFTGVFELETQLRYKEKLANEICADWFIHYDADEIRQAPKPYKTLCEGIEAADRNGYNAIDFDEFVFLPTADDESFEGRDYVEDMHYYYYFECDSPARYRTNAWKKHPEVDLHTFAGHKVVFPGLKIFPDPFILRHYIVLSRAHAIEKYAKRSFSKSEMAKSWHEDRASFSADKFSFPARERLKKIDATGDFDKSKPWKSHNIFSNTDSFRNARVMTANLQPSPTVSAMDRSAAMERQRVAVLKKFRADHQEHIPSIEPVPALAGRPFWSVMIPTYNANKRYFVEALESVLIQAPGPTQMQIEVVDDGTPAFDLEAVVKDMGEGRVAFYRQPRNLGLAANWNTCIQRSRGLWVHIMHQDDKLREGFYDHLRGPCERDQRLAAAFCRSASIDEVGNIQWMQEVGRETSGIMTNFIAREAANNLIISPSIVIRRAVYEEIGGYHTGMPYCTDWDMYKRVAVYGHVWYETRCLAYWRQHAASATAKLKSAGDDLVDRCHSIELSKAYVPSGVETAVSNAALKNSLLWATDNLREGLVKDNFATALAQAREILSTLQPLIEADRHIEGLSPIQSHCSREDLVKLQAKVDCLEAQVLAWVKMAEALQKKYEQLQKKENLNQSEENKP